MCLSGHTNVVSHLLFIDKEKSKQIIMNSYYYGGNKNKRLKN